MSEQLHEQVSAFVDGELPEHETELLLRRLERDRELQRAYARYIVMGAVMRREPLGSRTNNLVERVHRAVAEEGAHRGNGSKPLLGRSGRWLRPLAGAAVAAAVATVAILGVQRIHFSDETAVATTQIASTSEPVSAPVIGTADSTEPPSYVVPPYNPERRALPAARLTNYVLAHSEYSPLGRRGVLSGVITEDPVAMDDPAPAPGDDASTTAPQP